MNPACLGIPLGMQALAIIVDEFAFHRRRGLPRWERVGHPIDTLSLIACFCIPLSAEHSPQNLSFYITAGTFSCLLVTKDEKVHAKLCDWREQWLHALLFLLHPISLVALAVAWSSDNWSQLRPWILGQTALMILWMIYQSVYWNFMRPAEPIA